jgi:Icc-related predicted phosphoesterase
LSFITHHRLGFAFISEDISEEEEETREKQERRRHSRHAHEKISFSLGNSDQKKEFSQKKRRRRKWLNHRAHRRR